MALIALCTPPVTPANAITRVITPVWTEHNDNGRTGNYNSEITLNPSNVNQTQFGKVFAYNLDDQSYGQPLYVPVLTMSVDNAIHNVVFVTTVNNSVYAFDANSGASNGGAPLWHVNLTPTGFRAPNVQDADNQGACGGGYVDIAGQYGIIGTPVIDVNSNTLYVVARTVENGTFIQRLHALSLTSGAEKFGGPVAISGSYGGTTFDPALNNQRPALALINGVVYIGWSSHCDNGNYHGYLMGYNAATLAQTAVWSSTSSNGGAAGIWMGGQGVTADASNNLYLMTGNGTWDGTANFGESFVKLSPSLAVLDFFTPSNYDSLNGGDEDLGSAGCMGIPGTTLVIGGGKQGTVYLVDTSNLSQEHSTDAVVQEFQATFPQGGNSGHIHGGPIYFNSASGQFIYLWGENDFLHAYSFTNGAASNQATINSTPVANSTMRAPVANAGMPGGFLSLSSNGNKNGIIWALTPYDGDANHGTVNGILHAFDAQTFNGTVLTELWSSEQNHARDTTGNYAKFTYPTIANGRVYVSTFGSTYSGSGQLVVYGENPAEVTAPPVIQSSGSIVPQQVTITDATAGATIYYTLDGGVPAPGNADTLIYTAPFTVSACCTVTAMAKVNQDGWLQSASVSAAFTKLGTAGSGTGLTATYFSAQNLTGTTVQRTDPTVNFIWNGQPVTGIGPNNWSARWLGFVQPEFTDTYTFTTVADDGVRLWVNNQLLVDDWVDQGPTAKSGTIVLQAGQQYSIKMEYYQDGGGAQAQLYWSSSCQSQQIIPATQLFGSVPQVADPVISPVSGLHSGNVNVTITDATAGASIYYTTDGSTPTTASTLYSVGFSVPTGTKVQAIAVETGDLSSNVVSAAYTEPVPSPWTDIDIGNVLNAGSASYAGGTFLQTGSGDDIWNNADAFNFIYQPLNGDGTVTAHIESMGNTDPWSKAGVMIRGSLTAGSAQAIMAATAGNGLAFQDRRTDGDVSNHFPGANVYAPYWLRIQRTGSTLTGFGSPDGANWTQVGTDTITLPSTVYVGMALCAHNNTLINNASFDNVSVTFSQSTAAPSIAPAGGTFTTSTPVTLSDTTTGASIYYTTDGSTPTMASTLYAGQFTLNKNATLNAMAVLPGNSPSAVSTAAFSVVVATPTFSPPAGVITGPTAITINDTTPGASIYYTTNGTTPRLGVSGTTHYTVPVTRTPNTSIKAIAIVSGATNSAVASASYVLPSAAKPTTSPVGGTHVTSSTITLSDATTGSSIYYTTDGSTPNPGVGTTIKYTVPFIITASCNVKAIATAPGFNTSAVLTQGFAIQTAKPALTPNGGTHTGPVSVTINDDTPGAVIYYTTDGTAPTVGGGGSTITYATAFNVSPGTTVEAVAKTPGTNASAVAAVPFH